MWVREAGKEGGCGSGEALTGWQLEGDGQGQGGRVGHRSPGWTLPPGQGGTPGRGGLSPGWRVGVGPEGRAGRWAWLPASNQFCLEPSNLKAPVAGL